MNSDATEQQGGPERRRSQEISLDRRRPPLEVPGYEAERCLGIGAFGEVWVALEENTGRRVAIKFYTHGGGLDWSLLAREVEKLSFLFSDRYIVQLLSVGWNAEPPYYIMEHLERGSLAARLREGPLSLDEAVGIFRGTAVGLVHAHDKGVLHCDLKPANILLDQDGHPRLADFGQSRLSHEQIPSLGTLFYMAPEQARLNEAPDARWDVYALGAVLYCMLTGGPPHRTRELVEQLENTPDLQKRLNIYYRAIRKSPPPDGHRRVAGLDRDLQEIVDRCLAARPEDRFPNVQAVLAELDARQTRRTRRPMVLLGAIGPALLLLVVFTFALWGSRAALNHSEAELTGRVLQANEFAAQYVAQAVGDELKARYRAAESLANRKALRDALIEATSEESPLKPLLAKLADPSLEKTARGQEEIERLREAFRTAPAREKLQEVFSGLITRTGRMPEVVGWFLNDAGGVQVARWPQRESSGKFYATIGGYFGWRSYFYGGNEDKPEDWKPAAGEHIEDTLLSPIYQSQAINRWVVTVSTPIFSSDDPNDRRFLGVVSLMVELGRFVEFFDNENQWAVLVDARAGRNKGLILQHPMFGSPGKQHKGPPAKLSEIKVDAAYVSNPPRALSEYYDPLSPKRDGEMVRWLAYAQPVRVGEEPVGLVVIVQEDYASGIGGTMAKLASSMFYYGLSALAIIAALMLGLWFFAMRLYGRRPAVRLYAAATESDLSPGSSSGPLTPRADDGSPTETLSKKL